MMWFSFARLWHYFHVLLLPADNVSYLMLWELFAPKILFISYLFRQQTENKKVFSFFISPEKLQNIFFFSFRNHFYFSIAMMSKYKHETESNWLGNWMFTIINIEFEVHKQIAKRYHVSMKWCSND